LSSSDVPDIRTGPESWLHFAGIGGSGMSGLAQFHAQTGGTVTGSDRAFDQGQRQEIRIRLEDLGIGILPQDGSFLAAAEPGGSCAGRTCAAVVVSTAVEDRVGDIAAARKHHIPVLHRSELLAMYVAEHRTIAVSGTSGKSTVTAMVFTILRACGYQPGLLTGGPLASLVNQGHLGNAWAPGVPEAGASPPYLVIEADESDGSLVRYRPWAGIVLNLGLDHKTPQEVMDMFLTFKDNVTGPLVVGADANLAILTPSAELFGVENDGRPGTWAHDVRLRPDGSDFRVEEVAFSLPVPGLFNVKNATAAIAACRSCGIALESMVAPLAGFAGVARRFVSVGTAAGVEVIDDFAHNPDKIAAALSAAHRRVAPVKGRVLAVCQPHGFGPTRFLRQALTETFALAMETRDILWLPEIYFAGGTVTRDISSRDLVQDIRGHGRDARFLAAREELPAAIATEARPGDLVLVMGARDPSLTGFCRVILENLGEKPG
jgi:UDP-N-acetylmuramate-alanine ligase